MSFNADDMYRQPAGKKSWLKILLPAAIIVVAGLVSLWMMENRPKTKPRPVARNAMLVETTPVEFGAHQTEIQAMGLIKPSLMVELKPQVSGEIIAVDASFLPGGYFRAGERVLAIDPTDYRLAVRQRSSAVARAEAELQLEQGSQLIARKEFELLNEQVSPEEEALMLRQPQLESSRAAYEAAVASLEQARIDLQRTEITAPFNAVVQSREVNLGTRVTPATSLATLVGTDEYWVEIAVPVSQLEWIGIPGPDSAKGAKVRIFDTSAWGEERYRAGEVIGLAATVEEQGRMARLLASIPDPLARNKRNLGKPVVLLDTSMQVAITSRPLQDVAAINRQYLRDNNTVWIMDAQDKLDIRPVQVVFRERDQVFIADGLSPGERLITSNLPAPVQGMLLRTVAENRSATPATGQNRTDPPGRTDKP